MRWLLDAHFPVRLAVYLRDRGHDCDRVVDVGLGRASDIEVWREAIRTDRIVVSRDEDFWFLALREGDAGRLLWVRLGNCSASMLVAAMERAHDEVVEAFATGQRVVEVW